MRSEIFLLCWGFLLRKAALIMGTYVSESMNAPRMAKATVCAIGLNIFPSTPTSARMGRYTIRIMISPNAAEFLIFDEDSYTSASISDWDNIFGDLRKPR